MPRFGITDVFAVMSHVAGMVKLKSLVRCYQLDDSGSVTILSSLGGLVIRDRCVELGVYALVSHLACCGRLDQIDSFLCFG